jgi:hypothetical protein
MKNKGLIIGGGLAIVALGAFLWMRKKNQMAEDGGIDDAKSDTSASNAGTTAGTTAGTGKLGSSPTSTSPTQRTDGASVKGSGKDTKGLLSKNIVSVDSLQGTPLGLEISLPLLNAAQKFKLKLVIQTLPSGEKAILNYIAVVDATTRNSEAFKTALASTLGSQAPAMIDVVYNKILSASTITADSTSTGSSSSQPPSVAECTRQALASGIKPWEARQIVDYVNRCRRTSFDGSYFAQPTGEHAYSRQGFEIDAEDYGFNGDNIL